MGHGGISVTLYKFNISDTDTCQCGQPDTAEHIVIRCREEECEWKEPKRSTENDIIARPCTLGELAQEKSIEHLSVHADTIMKKGEQLGTEY